VNTHAIEALLDHAAERSGAVIWRDRGPRYGEERWIVTLVLLGKAPHARGVTREDAARALCQRLEIIVHAETAA
jgi:hypothetical protein